MLQSNTVAVISDFGVGRRPFSILLTTIARDTTKKADVVRILAFVDFRTRTSALDLICQ